MADGRGRNKRKPRDLGLLAQLCYVRPRDTKGDCVFLEGARKHTVYQDHKKCAGVSIISIIKCSVIALLCRPCLMVNAITETGC